MPPATPGLASALQHALLATMAITYLVAAFIQVHRNNLLYGIINTLIALLLTYLLRAGVTTHGRLLDNYTVRLRHKRLRAQHPCDWCGETIDAKAPAISHRGAINGEPFRVHHHPECDHAITQWYVQNSDETTIDLPLPKHGSMQRGSPNPRS